MKMNRFKIVYFLMLICLTVSAYAGTLDDIKANVKSNYNAVEDLTAVMDTDQTYYSDVVDADYKEAGLEKFRYDGTGTDVRKIRSNGTTIWHDYDGSGWDTTAYSAWITDSDSHYKNDASIFDFNSVIDDNTWTLEGGTETISGIECYKITSTNYDMWVDTATKTKTIKIVNNNEDTEYAILTGWSEIESTAYIADTIDYYYNSDSKTTTLSDISINDSLPSSTWEVQ